MRLLSTMMKRFVQAGKLVVIDVDGKVHEFGPEMMNDGDPSVTIKLHDKKLYRDLFLNP